MIILELNGEEFEIGTRGERGWFDLTEWAIEVSELLSNQGTSQVIPASQANLVDATPVSLYTVNAPSENLHIILEFGVYRRTINVGATNLSVTGTIQLSYNPAAASWTLVPVSNGDPKVIFAMDSNTITATAEVLTGDPDTSYITFTGRIIKV